MLCAGCVRKKNVQNTLLKNLLDACGASVAFFTVGYAFAFGGTDPESSKKTFVGGTNFFLMGVDDLAYFFFQYAFSATAATCVCMSLAKSALRTIHSFTVTKCAGFLLSIFRIVAGTLAERCQMAAYMSYSIMLSGWVYPIVVHAIWNRNGFLSASSVDPLWGVGMVDFAGSGVVHLTGGTTALFATIILGPRRGRFHDDTGRRLETPRDFPGSSFALQVCVNHCS